LKILFIGDVFGNPGRKAIKECVPQLKKELEIDFVLQMEKTVLREAA